MGLGPWPLPSPPPAPTRGLCPHLLGQGGAWTLTLRWTQRYQKVESLGWPGTGGGGGGAGSFAGGSGDIYDFFRNRIFLLKSGV